MASGGGGKGRKGKGGCWTSLMRCLGSSKKEEWTGASPPDYDSIFAEPPGHVATMPDARQAGACAPDQALASHGQQQAHHTSDGYMPQPGRSEGTPLVSGSATLPPDPGGAEGNKNRSMATHGAGAPGTEAAPARPSSLPGGAVFMVPGLQVAEGTPSGQNTPRPASNAPSDPGIFDIPDAVTLHTPPASSPHPPFSQKPAPPRPPPRPATRSDTPRSVGGGVVEGGWGLSSSGRLGGARIMGGEGVSVSVSAALAVTMARPMQPPKAVASAAAAPNARDNGTVMGRGTGGSKVQQMVAKSERMDSSDRQGGKGAPVGGGPGLREGANVSAAVRRAEEGMTAAGTAMELVGVQRAGGHPNDQQSPDPWLQPPPPSPTGSSFSNRTVDKALTAATNTETSATSVLSSERAGIKAESSGHKRPAPPHQTTYDDDRPSIPTGAATSPSITLPVIPKLLVKPLTSGPSPSAPRPTTPAAVASPQSSSPPSPFAASPLPEFPKLFEKPPPPPPPPKPAVDQNTERPAPTPPALANASTSEMPKLPKLALNDILAKHIPDSPTPPNRVKAPTLPARETGPSNTCLNPNQPATLQASSTLAETPQHTPRTLETPRHAPFPHVSGTEDDQDLTVVLDANGHPVDCQAIEKLVTQLIPAVQRCMLVRHWTSPEVGCLITLPTTHGGAGSALEVSALQLAFKSGSEATTVISARQCARFRHGLSVQVQEVNRRIPKRVVQIRRFQVLREGFSQANGLLNSNGDIERAKVLKRYRHIIDDMYHHEHRQQHKWMLPSASQEPVTPPLANTPPLPESNDPTASSDMDPMAYPKGSRGAGRLTPRLTSVEPPNLDPATNTLTPSPQPLGAKEPDTTTLHSLLGYNGKPGGGGGRSGGADGESREGQLSPTPQLTPRSGGVTPRGFSPRGAMRGGAVRHKGANNKGFTFRSLPESSQLLPLVGAAGGGQTPRGAYSPAFTVAAVTPYDRDAQMVTAGAEGLARSCMPAGVSRMDVVHGDDGGRKSPRRGSGVTGGSGGGRRRGGEAGGSGGRKRGGEVGGGNGSASPRYHASVAREELANAEERVQKTVLGERLPNGSATSNTVFDSRGVGLLGMILRFSA